MNSGYRLMERLAHITGFKDTRRLELSLLKTLQELFNPDTLLLVKLSSDNQPLFLLRYDSTAHLIIDDDPAHLCSDTQALIVDALSQNHLTAASSNQSEKTSVFPVLNLFELNLCLVLKSPNGLSADDNRLICSFLDVYRNFCLLIEDVQTDQLTGLLNRKTFEQNFQRISEDLPSNNIKPKSIAQLEVNDRRALAPAGMNSFWMAVIDIDDFKRVNDTFSHVYGDEVLILLARIMKACFRNNDQLYRFGGEEFVVITQCQNLEGAHFVFERLRKTIAEYDFPQIGQVTVSIGVVQLRTGVLATALFDQADQALYHVKENGKNQVEFYQELVSRGLIKPVTTLSGAIEIF